MNKAAGRAIFALQRDPSMRKATVYLEPNYVVKATRKEKARANSRSRTFLVTIGAPNFVERRFIKQLKAAKEPFPVKKVVLDGEPVPRPGAWGLKRKRRENAKLRAHAERAARLAKKSAKKRKAA